MAERLIYVREQGTTEYDILYLSEEVSSIEEFHKAVKEALGKGGEIQKIMIEDIAIKNMHGIKYMFKKSDPKIEVVFETGGKMNGNNNGFPMESSGSNNINPYRNFQVQSVPITVTSPTSSSTDNSKWLTVLEKYPTSFGHAAVNVNDHLFVFGGYSEDHQTNHSLLLNDIRGGKFSRLKTRGDVPSARERHTLSLIGRKIFLFGGYCRDSEDYYDTLYLFESETLTWTQLEPIGNPPERRCGHSASVIDGKIWIFGGRSKPKKSSLLEKRSLIYKNDLHCYDPGTNEWIRYDTRGVAPSGRSLHTATVVGRKIYIFGGANSTGHRNDTTGFCDIYELDIDTMIWAECQTQNTPPPPCFGHSASYIGDNRILFFGGKGFQVLNTIHVLNLTTMEWKQHIYAGNTLVPRWGHSATSHDNKIVIYGGRAAPGYYNTIDIIDTTIQLLELKPDEQHKEKHKRRYEEKNKMNEALGNLQNATVDLTDLTNHLGEQLLIQKKAILETRSAMQVLKQENESLKQQLKDIAPDLYDQLIQETQHLYKIPSGPPLPNGNQIPQKELHVAVPPPSNPVQSNEAHNIPLSSPLNSPHNIPVSSPLNSPNNSNPIFPESSMIIKENSTQEEDDDEDYRRILERQIIETVKPLQFNINNNNSGLGERKISHNNSLPSNTGVTQPTTKNQQIVFPPSKTTTTTTATINAPKDNEIFSY